TVCPARSCAWTRFEQGVTFCQRFWPVDIFGIEVEMPRLFKHATRQGELGIHSRTSRVILASTLV
ncbi:hypothetical protein Pgy4_36757, partial [Pseudomonas savastanoi pv. glycinea str. race 4]